MQSFDRDLHLNASFNGMIIHTSHILHILSVTEQDHCLTSITLVMISMTLLISSTYAQCTGNRVTHGGGGGDKAPLPFVPTPLLTVSTDVVVKHAELLKYTVPKK